MKSGAKFHWNPEREEDFERAFIDIVLKNNGHIGGYAVIEIDKTQPYTYQGRTLKSVLFPKVNDGYQDVTKEYVDQKIEKVKNR